MPAPFIYGAIEVCEGGPESLGGDLRGRFARRISRDSISSRPQCIRVVVDMMRFRTISKKPTAINIMVVVPPPFVVFHRSGPMLHHLRAT